MQTNTLKSIMNNVLVVGSVEIDRDIYASHGFNIVEHWKKVPVGAIFPNGIDTVVLVSDKINTHDAREVKAQCEEKMIALVYTHADLRHFQESINKAQSLLEKQLEATFDIEMEQKRMDNETKVDGRSNGNNVQAATMKADFVRDLLRTNPLMSLETVQSAVITKFGKAMTPTTITRIRWDNFGVRFGARGKVVYKDAKNAPTPINTPKAAKKLVVTDVPEPKTMVAREPQAETLTQILSQLRTIMPKEGITALDISASGKVRATYSVQRDLEVNLPQ